MIRNSSLGKGESHLIFAHKGLCCFQRKCAWKWSTGQKRVRSTTRKNARHAKRREEKNSKTIIFRISQARLLDNDVFTICPSEGSLQPRETQTVTLTYKHLPSFAGTNKIPVLLKITRGREVLVSKRRHIARLDIIISYS